MRRLDPRVNLLLALLSDLGELLILVLIRNPTFIGDSILRALFRVLVLGWFLFYCSIHYLVGFLAVIPY